MISDQWPTLLFKESRKEPMESKENKKKKKKKNMLTDRWRGGVGGGGVDN